MLAETAEETELYDDIFPSMKRIKERCFENHVALMSNSSGVDNHPRLSKKSRGERMDGCR